MNSWQHVTSLCVTVILLTRHVTGDVTTGDDDPSVTAGHQTTHPATARLFPAPLPPPLPLQFTRSPVDGSAVGDLQYDYAGLKHDMQQYKYTLDLVMTLVLSLAAVLVIPAVLPVIIQLVMPGLTSLIQP